MNRTFIPRALFALSLVAIHGCFDFSSSEEHLLRTAFEAISKNDWDRFEPVYKNRFVLLSRQTSPNIFAARQSFAGAVMAPEEKKRVQQRFERAAAGTAGDSINFQTERFKSLKRLQDVRDEILSEFGSNPEYRLRSYAVITREAPPNAGPRYPIFLVTDGPIPRIVDLVLPDG